MAMAPIGADGAGDGGYKPLAEINVTPFVDVMLVLLIIFMVAAPLMMVGVPVELPKTSAAKMSQPRKPLVVSITHEGKIFVRDEEVAAERLIARLSDLHTADGEAVVYVRGDRELPYGRVMEVMGQVGRAGFARVSLIAEAAAHAPSRP